MSRFTLAILVVAVCAVVLILSAPSSWAAAAKNPAAEKAAAKKAGDPPADPEQAEEQTPAKKAEPKPLTEDQKKIAAIRADMDKDVDKAIEAARDYVKDGMDEDAKTDAMGVIADGLRKKGDWKGAQAAYQKARDRCEKGSEGYLKYDAILDILKASPAGIYAGMKAADAKPLSDDAALDAALQKMTQIRLDKLKNRLTPLKRAKTPQELVTLFTPIVEEYRQAAMASPAAGAAGHDAAAMANGTLQEISAKLMDYLRNRQTQFQPKMDKPWGFTNVEKKDMGTCRASCKELAAGEKGFQQLVTKLAGSGDWAEGKRVMKDSDIRRDGYERMAESFVVPEWTEIRLGW